MQSDDTGCCAANYQATIMYIMHHRLCRQLIFLLLGKDSALVFCQQPQSSRIWRVHRSHDSKESRTD
eukprot:scaffold58854_cov33-Prasinocladus_malaysianus.AAC.1